MDEEQKEKIIVNLNDNTVRLSNSKDLAVLIGKCSADISTHEKHSKIGVIRIKTDYDGSDDMKRRYLSAYMAARNKPARVREGDNEPSREVWLNLMGAVQQPREGTAVAFSADNHSWSIEYDREMYKGVVIL